MLKSLSFTFMGNALGVPAQFKHFLVWMIHEHPHQSCKTPCNLSKVNTDKNCVSPPLESGQPHGSWVWAGHWVGPEYSQILTQFLHILPSPAGSPECSEWYRGVSVNHVSNSNMFWQLFELHHRFLDEQMLIDEKVDVWTLLPLPKTNLISFWHPLPML